MEKSESDTHDFMKVESFSQLPFIRPTIQVSNNKEKGIRLFGKEFGAAAADSSTATDEDSGSVESSINNNNGGGSGGREEAVKESSTSNSSDNNNGESSRKFECHYCCRNFPTSQALGGHQNAHKRERQHAKRAHLQSAMLGLSEAHAYGFLNYHRLGSAPPAPPPPGYHHHHQPWSHHTGSSSSFNSYSSSTGYNNPNTATTMRFYCGGGGAYPQRPINGSPLGLWRIPQVHSSTLRRHDHYSSSVIGSPVPLFSTDELNRPSSTQNQRFAFESKPAANMQDHVSLDLRL